MKLLLFTFYPLFLVSFKDKTDLTIQIKGIEEIKGRIQIGIYSSPDKFLETGAEYRVEYVNVSSNEIIYAVKDLPKGDYSIALFHDINSDGICNLNFWGIPTEPYGFSNNIKPVLRAPSFSDTKISVYEDTRIRITLID